MRNRRGDSGDGGKKGRRNLKGNTADRKGKCRHNYIDKKSEGKEERRKGNEDYNGNKNTKNQSEGSEKIGNRSDVDKVDRNTRLKELYFVNEEKKDAIVRRISDEGSEVGCCEQGRTSWYGNNELLTSNYSENNSTIVANPDVGDSIESESKSKYSLLKKSCLLPCSQNNTPPLNDKASQRELDSRKDIGVARVDYKSDWSRLHFGSRKDQAVIQAYSSTWIWQTTRENIDKHLKIEEKCSKYSEISASFNIFIIVNLSFTGLERPSAQIVKQIEACDSGKISESEPKNVKFTNEPLTKEGHKDTIRLALVLLNARSEKGRIKVNNKQEGKQHFIHRC